MVQNNQQNYISSLELKLIPTTGNRIHVINSHDVTSHMIEVNLATCGSCNVWEIAESMHMSECMHIITFCIMYDSKIKGVCFMPILPHILQQEP